MSESEARDTVSPLRVAELDTQRMPRETRARSISSVPNLDEIAVEVVKQGWLHKQGGARGGRKSWKRRWFVLKDDSLYYKESPESTVLLGVMPLHGCHILDLGHLTQSAPPPYNDTQTVCHECKKPFTFLERKHHCRHCGNTFCNNDSQKRIAIPKFGFHSRVRVCDSCYESVAAELESSEVVLKLLELTGEKPDAANNLIPAVGGNNNNNNNPANKASTSAIAVHAQAMEQLKQRAAIEKATTEKRPSLSFPDKKRFTLPTVNKPHLFALKNSERELWLHAENQETRLEWVQAIRGIQKRKVAASLRKNGKGAEDAVAKSDAPSWEIDYQAITVLNKVGVGAFGEVFRARLWGTEVAMKTLKTEQFKDSAALLDELKKEVSILSQLRHPNVVLYIGACTLPPHVCLLTEWCSKGSLYDVLHDYSVHLSSKLCIDLAMGIAQGMNYLHSLEKKIIHRDLKSMNILVNKQFAVKVADFGLSHVRELRGKGAQPDKGVVATGPRHYGIFGTPEWMAPEVMEGSIYTEAVDTYSFGILLSEIVTRQMPFHDQFKISSYMDVVEAVLDNGAIPTIPKWCEGLLGGLIRACVSRNPADRPTFTDLILRLREVADLDDSVYFFAFDLPRLRELMMSPLPAVQSLAASEVAALLANPQVRRRSSPNDNQTPFSPSVSSNSPMPLSPIKPSEIPSTTTSGESHSAAVAATVSARAPHLDGDCWILDDEDAFDFLERFSALLSSSHREVQLNSCKALRSLLHLSATDRPKRALDRELIIQAGGLGSLLALLLSEQENLSSAAGEVLLLLTEDMTDSEQTALRGLNSQGLSQLSALVAREIQQDEVEILEKQARMQRKKAMRAVVDDFTKEQNNLSNKDGQTPMAMRKPKARAGGGKKSMTPLKFNPTGNSPNPIMSPMGIVGNEDSDSDDDRVVSQQLLQAAAAQKAKQLQEDDNDDYEDAFPAGGRGRATTAVPMKDPKRTEPNAGAAGADMASIAESVAINSNADPTNPVLLNSFMQLNELLSHAEPPAEKFTDWYSNIKHASYTLRYDLEGDSWQICYAVFLSDSELRLFHHATDEPDEPITIIRTKPNSHLMGGMEDDEPPPPVKLRLGHKHGMPFCFQVEDCGRIFTFCAGNHDAQMKWKSVIVGDEPTGSADGQTNAAAAAAGQATMLPAFSISANAAPAKANTDAKGTNHPQGLYDPASAALSPAAAAALAAPPQPVVKAPPLLRESSAPEDPTRGREVIHLELPTPPFAKRYRDITCHGYLFIRDRNTNQWGLKYCVLVGSTLRVFDSHRSSPNDPYAEHEVDAEYTNVNASDRGGRVGVNEFFIRLHSSSVQFDCWADSAAEKNKWIVALCADHIPGGLSAASSSAASSSSTSAPPPPARIAAFAAYYDHIDYYGYLYRRRKLTNRWLREFVVLVDSEIHYYTSVTDAVDQPNGTFYIATNSGKAFHVKQSSKRAHCLGIVNPSRTFYLAAETEREYLCWVNAIHQNQKRLMERQKMQRNARASISAVR